MRRTYEQRKDLLKKRFDRELGGGGERHLYAYLYSFLCDGENPFSTRLVREFINLAKAGLVNAK